MNLDLATMTNLLGQVADEKTIQGVLGVGLSQIERDEHYGSLVFKDDGIDVVLKEGLWILHSNDPSREKSLHIVAFHLHREGHEGFAMFRGALPGQVAFGDTQEFVEAKLGSPDNTGGGGFSKTLGKMLPKWIRYRYDRYLAHFQFDAANRLEMVTVSYANK